MSWNRKIVHWRQISDTAYKIECIKCRLSGTIDGYVSSFKHKNQLISEWFAMKWPYFVSSPIDMRYNVGHARSDTNNETTDW